MKIMISALFAFLLTAPTAVFAATNCDDQAKPALECPTGYAVMCIPTGGDHWGCGRETPDGAITEAPSTEQPQGSLQIEPVSAPSESAPAEPAPTRPADNSQTGTVSEAPAAVPTQGESTPTAPAPPPPTPASPTGELTNSTNDTNDMITPEELQEKIEAVAEYAPEPIQPVLGAIAGTLGAVVMFLGIWEWLKRMKEKKTGKCGRCGGDTADEPCKTCGGKGTVEKEVEMTVKCTHCKGSGVDPCHHCSGTGKMSMPIPAQSQEELESWPPCDFCGGSGVKKVGAGRDWGEANDAVKNGQFACCFCKGKKEETVTVKREVACPDCNGKK